MHQPLGPTLGKHFLVSDFFAVICPWNFPFWLPFKTAIPPLIIGNSILLKHSPSTPLCALALQEIFNEA